jgi:DNA mismatch endonuclease (patch repair protein)
VDYWRPKLDRNADRDGAQTLALVEAGWTVIRIWEHQAAEEGVALVLGELKRAGL